ncbi:MAG: response regulator [Pseudomonadota bacterium]
MDKIDFSRMSVLVVDDNMHMRKIIRTLLIGFGIRTVWEAEDGAAALELYEQNNPDIIITDWVMPIIDGIELVQMIRRPSGVINPFVPIIMLSGHAEKRRVTEARDAGVHEFLCKPISARSLYLRIYSVIAFPRPFVKTEEYFGPDRRRFENPLYKGPERRADATVIEIEDDSELKNSATENSAAENKEQNEEQSADQDAIDAMFA